MTASSRMSHTAALAMADASALDAAYWLAKHRVSAFLTRNDSSNDGCRPGASLQRRADRSTQSAIAR